TLVTNVRVAPALLPSRPQGPSWPVHSWRPSTSMRSAFMAVAAMNFIRSPDGVMIGPLSRLSRSQVATPVSLLSEPGMATMATRFFPSVLMDTDWMSGSRAKASIGIGSAASEPPVNRQSDMAAARRNLDVLITPPEHGSVEWCCRASDTAPAGVPACSQDAQMITVVTTDQSILVARALCHVRVKTRGVLG